jgi:gliding motility-associated-like protein
MKHLTLRILFFTLWLSSSLTAQVILTPIGSPETMTACGSSEEFRLSVINSNNQSYSSIPLEIDLPNGMEYVAGSVSGPLSELDISDPLRPRFLFSNLAPLSNREIQISCIINCAFSNERGPIYTLELPGNPVSTQEQPLANFFFPEVVITNIDYPVLDLAVAGIGLRTFTIIQSTSGASLDTLFFINRYDPGMETLGLNLGQLIGSSPGIDTFMITGAELPGGDGGFDAGDTLRLSETVRLLDCAPANSSIELYWRCGSVVCQSFQANTLLTQATGSPDLRIWNTNGFPDQATANNPSLVGGGFCDTLELSYRMENQGAEDAPGAGAIYDLVLALGLNNNLYSSSLPSDLGIFPNWTLQVSMNGNPVDLGTYHYPAANPLLGFNLNFSQLTSDPDGPGGLEDIDGDGFFDDLAVGSSTEFVVAIIYDPYVTTGCAYLSGYPYNGGAETNFRLGYQYRDQCYEDRSYWYSVNDSGTNVVALFTHRSIIYTVSLSDNNLAPGDISILEIRPDGAWNSPCGATDSFILEVVLPDGLVAEPIAYGPGNFDGIIGQSGDTVWLASDERGTLTQPWGLGLSIDCNEAIVDTTLEVSFLYFCDSDCGPMKRINCQEIILDYLPQCEECLDGIDTRSFSAVRQSLGWTNAAHTQQVDPATDPTINLSAGINRDSVMLTLNGVFRGGGPFDELYSRIIYHSIDPAYVNSAEAHFEPLNTIVDYYHPDGSSFTCTGPAVTTEYDVASEEHRLHCNLEILFQAGGCLENITRTAGDSIVLRILTLVTDNTPRRALPIPEFKGQFYLLNNGSIISCNEFLDDFLLEEVVPNANLAYPNQEHYGCAPIFFNNNAIANPGHNYDADQFPNEVRSIVDVSEVRMILEGNWEHQSGSSELLANGSFDENDNVSVTAPFVTVPLPDPIVSFDGISTTFTYINDGSWPEGDLVIGGSNPIHNIRFEAIPGCLVPNGEAFRIEMQADMIRYLNAPAAFRDTITSISVNENKVYQGPRADLLLASPQEFIPDSDTVFWELEINNTTSYGHPDKTLQHVWLAISGAGAISNISFTDITDAGNPIPYPAEVYDSGESFWVRLGDIAPFATQRIRIEGIYRECEGQALIASLGHSCIDYPNPDPGVGYVLAGTTFSCPTAELSLSIQPRPVSLNVLIEGPPIPAPLCEPLDYTVVVSNVNLPTAYQHLLETFLPLGAEILPGSSRIEIPANSGNWQTLNDPLALPANVYQWDMSTDPNGIQELEGVDRSPANTYRLAFQLIARCGFNAGLRVGFRASAQNNCGQLEERTAYSERLLIEGLPQNINNYALAINTAEGGFDACDTTQINAKLINLGPDSSLLQEYAVVTLPLTFDLVPGSINGNTALIENNPLIENRLLRFAIPPGIAPGDSLSFSFQAADVRLQELACEEEQLSLAVVLESEVSCSLSPTDSCAIFLILNTDTLSAPILKDELALSLVDQRSVPFSTTGETLTTILSLTNLQAVPARTDSIIWEVYVDEDASGTLDTNTDQLLYTSPERPLNLAANGTLLDSISYTALSEQVCQLLVTYRNTGPACSCDPPNILVLPNPVLANTGPDQLVCSDEAIWLGTDNRQGNITFSWGGINGTSNDDITLLDSSFTLFQTTNSGLAPAIYYYQLQTNRGPNCVSRDSVSITVMPEIRPEYSVTSDYNGQDISCTGAADGSVLLTGNLGTSPISYSLNGLTQTSAEFDSLAVGTYTFELLDANGCTASIDAILTEPAPLSWMSDITDASCFDTDDGQIQLAVSGGTPDYQYSWSDGAADSPLNTGLSNGAYQATVTDSNDCTLITDSLMVNSPDTISYSTTQSATSCSYSQDGSFSLTEINGGTPPYQISWSDGSNGWSNTNLSVGNEALTITDGNGCDAIVAYEIVGPPVLELLNSEITDISCHGGADGAVNIQLQGGTLPYNYEWTNGAATTNINSLFADDYQVVVTDANGCLFTSPVFTVMEPSALFLRSVDIDGVSCYGQADGAIVVAADGGTAPYSYSWPGGQSGTAINLLPAGSYALSVTDANDCLLERTLNISEPTPLSAVVEQETPSCSGEPGIFRVFPDGGTAPYLFALGEGQNFQPFSEFEVGPGEYQLHIQDANGCLETLSAAMSEPDPLLIDAPEEIILNYGDSIDLLIPVYNIRGGTLVEWEPAGNRLSCNDCLAPRMYAWESTIFLLSVTDGFGCRAEAPISLIVEHPRRLFIPNAFSPNGLGDNELFFPYGAGEVAEIERMDIYNRWGGLMYQRNNFPPNDPSYGWDGRLNGKTLPAAVYVYYLEVRFTDGKRITYTGDVVLVR